MAQPRATRSYELEDEDEVLRGMGTSEIDLIFDAVPEDLSDVTEAWLASAMRSGGVVAWFGFEGSFDFEHVLTADVGNQIYGVAGRDFIALATDDDIRESEAWVDQLAVARRALPER